MQRILHIIGSPRTGQSASTDVAQAYTVTDRWLCSRVAIQGRLRGPQVAGGPPGAAHPRAAGGLSASRRARRRAGRGLLGQRR
jgi:hypothetical protein